MDVNVESEETKTLACLLKFLRRKGSGHIDRVTQPESALFYA